jgi:hypothetical protein
MHLNEYCPITLQIEPEGYGGFQAGSVYIQNKTGYDIDKAVIRVEFIKANGSLFDTQTLDFNNVKNGEYKPAPTRREERGTRLQHYFVSIDGSELTNGLEVRLHN